MTAADITAKVERCRHRATRLAVTTGTVGTLLGAAAIARVVAWHRSSVSRGSFLILAGLILATDGLIFVWALRAARQVPTICGAVCPNCGASPFRNGMK